MEQLINFIIRPPRAEYNPKNDLLDQGFMLKGKWYQRKDLEVVNSRGDTLQCSHYVPIALPEGKPLPCVIYCHGNSGCRTDASEAAIILLPSNITVFTLDFSGSGLSGGEHVTLGWNEKDDLKAVVDHLRTDGNVSLIGLWGRSMGAVTSLMYGAEDPSIAGMVLDSPFSDLVDLMMELVDTYKVRLPKFTVKFAIQYMRRAIQKKAKFDIMDLNTIKVAKACFVPALFGHATDDDFIQPHHSDRIFEAYVGDKNIIKFEGDHNSPRPQFYFDSICIFFNNVLQPPEDEVGKAYFDLTHDYFGKGSWSNFQDLEYSDHLLGSTAGGAASSTEEAIKQLRSRRPMSMIVVPSEISTTGKQTDGKVENQGSDSQASSSNMISFELSGASPNGSHMPASIDDDEYVEYSLETLADFPSSAEEEERMLMEAMLESLKDLDTVCPQVEEPSSSGGNDAELELEQELKPALHSGLVGLEQEPNPALHNGLVDKFSTQCDSGTKMDSNLAANDYKLRVPKCSPSHELETRENPLTSDIRQHNHNLPDENDVTDHLKEPLIIANDTPGNLVASHHRVGEQTRSNTASDGATQPGDQNSSEMDMADRTKVTMKVEKSPSSNIMDGLLRRWDLNFFRNR